MRSDDIPARLRRWAGAPDLSSPVVRSVIAASLAINLLVLAVPLYINRIYTSVLPQKAGDSLVVITALLFAVLVLDVLLKTCKAWVLSWLSASQEHQLRLAALRTLLAAPLGVSEQLPVESRLEQLRAPSLLRSLFEQQWLVRRVDLPFTLVYLLALALIGGWLVFVPVLLAPLFLMLASRAARQMGAALRRRQHSESFRDGVMVACLQGVSTVKSLSLEGFLVRRLEPSQEALGQAAFQLEASTAWLQNLSQLFAQWSQLLIVSVGGWLVINQQLSSGGLAACTLLAGQIATPLGRLFTAEAQQATLDLAQEQLDALLQLSPEPGLLSGSPAPARGELQVAGLRLPPGGLAVISGGSPHQTAAWLDSLTGLRGTIPADLRFAGTHPASHELVSLRKSLRLVRNGAPLLRGTILDHLTQFRPDLLGDQATALCERHGVASQVLSLPRGYRSVNGESRDFPFPSSLVFRLQVMQALMDAPAVLLVDASEVGLSASELAWLLGLEIEASRLIAVEQEPRLSWPEPTRHLVWQGERLQEVNP